jgi:predicted dehydrogenase
MPRRATNRPGGTVAGIEHFERDRAGIAGDEGGAVYQSQGKDQFVAEWQAFADAIARGRAKVNRLREAREDLEIAVEIIEAPKRSATPG